MPTIYRSTDGDAPVLNNMSGAFRNVMKAILVDGYGGKEGAGWEMPYVRVGGPAGDADPAVFRPKVGTRQFYRVKENYTFPFNQYEISAFESMTTVDAGVDNWAGGSPGARPGGAAAHPWLCVADPYTAYFFYQPTAGSGTWRVWTFGDFARYGAADAWNAFSYFWEDGRGFLATNPTNGLGPFANSGGVMRSVDGALKAGAIRLNLHSDIVLGRADGLAGNVPYPSPVDERIWLAPLYVGGGGGLAMKRGKLRGLWLWCHPSSAGVIDGDEIEGTGELAGKRFLIVKDIVPAFSPTGTFVIEISNTWAMP